MIQALLGIIPSIIGGISDNIKQKREVKRVITEKKIELIRQGQQLDATWEIEQAKASGASWKDEWFAVILSLPFLAGFLGEAEMAERAFDVMAKAPEWYTTAFLVAVGASFGVRLWKKAKT